jgi:hypothetical protein
VVPEIRIGGARQIPVLVSCGATAGVSYRMAGPGRGPGPEYSEEALAEATRTVAETANTSATSIARAAPLTPAKSRS